MIFLSYSNADLPSALIIKRTLEAGGVRCWKAPEDIQPGERWAAAIVRAIRESTVMVIVVSERSMSSPEVAKELALAMSRRLTIIPLRIEEAELTDEWAYHFATIQWLDAFGGRLEAVCQRLVQNFATAMAAATVMEAVPQSETSGDALPDADNGTAAVSVPRILPIAQRAPDDAIDWSTMDLPLPQVWWWEHLNTISDATVEKGETAVSDSRTGRHQRLWAEVTAWLADLSRIALGPEPWKNNPSQFQQGKLSYTYWARISPVDGRDFLGDGLHIGVQLSKNGAKWTNGIDADVGVAPSQAVMALWASTNDRGIARMVNEQSILETYGWVQQETLLASPELYTGLVRDRRGRLMRAQTYLAQLERSEAGSNATGCTLWSPLITIDDVRSDPARVSAVVAEYLRILAEPVRVARAMVVPPTEDRPTRGRPIGPGSAPPLEAHVKPVDDSATSDIPPELRALAERLSLGDGASLTIRELLGWFGAQRRGSQVVLRVTAALIELIAEGHEALRPLQVALFNPGIDDAIYLPSPTSVLGTVSTTVSSAAEPNASAPDEIPDSGSLDLSALLASLAQQAGLIPAGATVHVVQGRPPLVSAVAGAATVAEVKRILASDDIEVDVCDTSPDAYSATHFAAWDGNVALLEVLLDAGAAVEIVARDGRTQMSLAATNGHTACVALLLERGSPVDTRIMAANPYSGIAGGTPLRDAVLNQHWDIVDLLLEAGADIAVLAEPCQGSPGGHADFFDAIQYEAYQGAMRTKLNVERTQILAAAVRGSDGSETDAEESVGEDDDSDDADTDTVLFVDWGDVGMASTVAFSPDGTRLATGWSDKTIRLADAGCGALLHTLTGHEDWVRRVRFSADGRWIASASDDMTVRLWDAETGEARGTVRSHEGAVYGLAFTPDARRIVSGSADKTVRIWEVNGLSLLRTLVGHEAEVRSVACSPDGRWIASGDNNGRLCIWDATSGDLRLQRDVSNGIHCVSFNEDGTLLAVGGERAMAEILDTSSWVKRYSLSDASSDLRSDIGTVYSVAFLGGRAVIGSDSSSVVMWAYPPDARSDDYRYDRVSGHLNVINEIAVTVDGTFMASVSDDSMVYVRRTEDSSVVWVANYFSVEEAEADSAPADSDESDDELDDVDKILQSLTTREVDDIDRILRSLGVSSTEDEKEDEDDAPAVAEPEPVVSASAREEWREKWWSGSERWEEDADDPYTDSPIRLVHPSDVVDVMAAARRLTAAESALIAARIRKYKVIPVLTFFPTRAEMKNTLWFHPLIVVAERFGSVMAVDKNGCYCAAGTNGDDLSLGAPFSPLVSHELEQLTPYLWRLTLSYDESGEQYTTLDEYVPAGVGAYLAILDAILEVNMPVVEASRDVPFWNHGAGGETWKAFESWDAMLGAAANWGGSDDEDSPEDASDEDAPHSGDAGEAKPEPPPSMLLYAPSPALRVIVGATPLSSTEIVARVWAYIKYFGLQDANNLRIITPDTLLAPVMGGNSAVPMSEMPGYLRQHMTHMTHMRTDTEATEDEADESDALADDGGDEGDVEWDAFELACINGDPAAMQSLLRDGHDVNENGASGAPPLSVAVAEGTLEVVRFLLDAGAAVNGQDDHDGSTPLNYALHRTDIDRRVLELLLDRGAVVNPDEHRTLLQTVADLGRVDLVDVALVHGSDLLVDGLSAVQAAAKSRHWEFANDLARRIAEAGGAVFPRLDSMVLHWFTAAHQGDIPTLVRLRAHVDVNCIDHAGQTALHLSVSGEHLESTALLLEWGADPNRLDADGCAPINRLHWAALENLVPVASLLLDHGADPRTGDTTGWTLAHHAFRHPTLMERLLTAGADRRAVTNEGDTPLHKCALLEISDEDDAACRLSVAKILLNGDPGLSRMRNSEGLTAWDYFVQHDYEDQGDDACNGLFCLLGDPNPDASLFAATDAISATRGDDQLEAIAADAAAPARLADLRKLLGDSDSSSILQALRLASALNDQPTWQALAAGVSLQSSGEINISEDSEINRTVRRRESHDEVALWALRGAGRLDSCEQLTVRSSHLRNLEWLRDLPVLRSLTLNFCRDLVDIDACGSLPALEHLQLNYCDAFVNRPSVLETVPNVRVRGSNADDFFEDIKTKGLLFNQLAKHGLIREVADQAVQARMVGFYDFEIDLGKNAFEASRLPIFIVDLSALSLNGQQHRDDDNAFIVENTLRFFPPLSHVTNRTDHFYDFLIVDAEQQKVVAMGLGRNCQLFIDVSTRGGEFTSFDKGKLDELSDLPFNIAENAIDGLDELSDYLCKFVHLERLQSLLEDGSDEDGTYEHPYRGSVTEKELVSELERDSAEVKRQLHEQSWLFRLYFPGFDAKTLITDDFQ